jgi:hypothetical protein
MLTPAWKRKKSRNVTEKSLEITQEMPGEELQRHHAMMRKMEEIHCVDDLLRRHVQVDDTEIIFQSMSDEDYPTGMEN